MPEGKYSSKKKWFLGVRLLPLSEEDKAGDCFQPNHPFALLYSICRLLPLVSIPPLVVPLLTYIVLSFVLFLSLFFLLRCPFPSLVYDAGKNKFWRRFTTKHYHISMSDLTLV